MKLEIEEKLRSSNTKEKLVNWLIENQVLVSEIIKKTDSYLKDLDPVFRDEFLEQQELEVKKLVTDEISRSIGLTSEDVSDTISEDTFSRYLKAVKELEELK